MKLLPKKFLNDIMTNNAKSGATASVIASSGSQGHGSMHVGLHLEARDVMGNVTGVYDNPEDIMVTASAGLFQANLLALATQSIHDCGNVARTITANSACTVPTIVAGLTATGATFTDYALGDGVAHTDYKTASSYAAAGTVNAITSNHFTVTGTITNVSGSSISYAEVGLACTSATWQFLLCHDAPLTGGPFTVSNNGTLAVTYTLTWS